MRKLPGGYEQEDWWEVALHYAVGAICGLLLIYVLKGLFIT